MTLNDIRLDVTAVPVVNYAMAHNRVPVITAVTLSAGPTAFDAGTLEIRLEDSEGPLSAPWQRQVSQSAGGTTVLDDIDLAADPAALLQVGERRPAWFVATLTAHDGTPLAQRRIETSVLAANQWLRASQILDLELLAAFVMPNHPAIGSLLGEMSTRLRNTTGSGSLDGYQSGEDRVDAIVAAVYEAMQARRIRYSEPPASWSDQGQKIRTPGQVLDERFGTCLDTVVTMAAGLEQAGVRPLIWLADGHAFLGYWRDERSLSQTAELDVSRMANLVDLGLIGLVETTSMTDRTEPVPFTEARAATTRWLRADIGRMLGVVDVYQARRSEILPLPAHVRTADGSVQVVEYRAAPRGERAVDQAAAAAAAPARPDARSAEPPRVTAWKNALLDLSLRNRLINLPERRATTSLVVPPDRLGEIEDVLSRPASLHLQAADAIDSVNVARGIRTAHDLPSDTLVEALSGRRTVWTNLTSDTYQKQLRALAYKARTVEEDTGANNLYLALGTLVWDFDGKQLRSPLILLPVHLRSTARQAAFRLELDEAGGSTPNFCLLEKLKQSRGIEIAGLAEPAVDSAGIDVDAALTAVRIAMANAGMTAHVEPTADLAILQFAKFRLWKDLDENWQAFTRNRLVHHFVHTPTARFDAPADSPAETPAADLDGLAAACPVAADSSQLRAVASAAAGETFVLEGPPGTGKSQTITNLLAHCVAEGRQVLFVAEKRAALDVVRRRLDAVGFGPFALDLHDKGSKPATVRAQIKAALDHQVTVDEEGWRADRDRLTSATRVLSRYAHDLHEPNSAGLSLYGAHDAVLARSRDDATGALDVPESVLTADRQIVDDLHRCARDLPEHATGVRPRPHHPWGFVASEGDPSGVAELAAVVDRAARDLPVSTPLDAVLAAVRTPAELDVLVLFASGAPVELAALDATREPAWQQAAADIVRRAEAVARPDDPAFALVTPAVVSLPLPEIDARARDAAASGFFGRKKRLRTVAAQLAPALRPGAEVDLKSLTSVTSALLKWRDSTQSLVADADRLPGLSVPAGWNPLQHGADPFRRSVTVLSDAGAMVVARPGERSEDFVRELRQWVSDRNATDPVTIAALSAVAAGLRSLASSTAVTPDSLADWLQGSPLVATWRSTVNARSDEGPQALQRWVGFVRALEPFRRAGMTAARTDLMVGRRHADDAASALRTGFARASVPERRRATGLGEFDAESHERTVARFDDAAGLLRHHLTAGLPHEVLNRRRFDAASDLGQIGALRRELSKQRRGMPIRTLLATYGALIVEAMPCVLVSPESVARFFPATDGLFDLVVFDEASQIRVADAVGAIGRARSAVVVGDSKQMPPTSVAEAGTADDEDGVEDDLLAVEDEESILSECVQSRVPQQWLSWHYRSQDESLIAFSNQKYYEDRLSSFPAPGRTGPRTVGLSLRQVPGHFVRSGRGKDLRTNQVEARAIVEEITRRFSASPDEVPSVGVVTFNVQQRTYIESLLRDAGDDRIVEALDRRDGEGLFVKNLENVQGDERDVILFSIAFSANDKGVLPLNFGPMNRVGGERRLNVAVTRARREIIVFASFPPSLLRAEETSSVGIKHLRAYLDFALASTGGTPPTLTPRPNVDRHRDAIAAALRDRGVTVTTDVGLSDFRIDLTLAAADRPETPVVAVLLDGIGWSRRATVGDRDGLPTTVLTGLMRWPAVRRVWLPQWLSDPDGVLDALVAAVHDAAVGADRPIAASPSPAPSAASAPVEAAAVSRGYDDLPPMMWGDEPIPALRLAAPSTASAGAGPGRHAATETKGLPGESPFRSWRPEQIGTADALDRLQFGPDRQAVHELLAAGIEAEGPVPADRLARLVAGAFGMQRVSSARVGEILRLVAADTTNTEGGAFLWPAARAPQEWRGFRTSADYRDRPVEAVALVEIANAMSALCFATGGMVREELFRETLRLFGGQRVTTRISARLADGLAVAQDRGSLRIEADVVLTA